MRVVCIEGNPNIQKGLKVKPVKVNMYTAIDEKYVPVGFKPDKRSTALAGIYYNLIEMTGWWHCSMFVVINEDQQDETEMQRNYKTEKV